MNSQLRAIMHYFKWSLGDLTPGCSYYKDGSGIGAMPIRVCTTCAVPIMNSLMAITSRDWITGVLNFSVTGDNRTVSSVQETRY